MNKKYNLNDMKSQMPDAFPKVHIYRHRGLESIFMLYYARPVKECSQFVQTLSR